MPASNYQVISFMLSIPGVGEKTVVRYLNAHSEGQKAYEALLHDFGKKPQMKPSEIDTQEKYCENNNIQTVTLLDDAYPEVLKQLHDPPPILFAKGDIGVLREKKRLGVVGTRRYTVYGEKVVHEMMARLRSFPVVTVSGLALGIDQFVHQKSLVNSIPTVAVLGSGVDVPTPVQNSRLYHEIIKMGGCIISEFPVGTDPQKYHFPKRNRIIAGLSDAVCVIEAGEHSGSLITAAFALEQGKDVYALPGPIFSHASFGTNSLLRDGAIPIVNVDSFVSELFEESLFPSNNLSLDKIVDPVQQFVVSFIRERGICLIDDILSCASVEEHDVLSAISQLEINGFVRKVGEQVTQNN